MKQKGININTVTAIALIFELIFMLGMIRNYSNEKCRQ